MQHIYHLSRETTETTTRRLLRPKGMRKKFEGASPTETCTAKQKALLCKWDHRDHAKKRSATGAEKHVI